MKNIFRFVILAFGLLLTSCEKDEELLEESENEASVSDIDLSQIPETRAVALSNISYKEFADKLENIQLECGEFMSNEDYTKIMNGIASGKKVSVFITNNSDNKKSVYGISLFDSEDGPSCNVVDMRKYDRDGNSIKHSSAMTIKLAKLIKIKYTYDVLMAANVTVKELDLKNNYDDYFMSPEYLINRHIFIYEVQSLLPNYDCKFSYQQFSFMLERFANRLNVEANFCLNSANKYVFTCKGTNGESWISQSHYLLKYLIIPSEVTFDASYNPYCRK